MMSSLIGAVVFGFAWVGFSVVAGVVLGHVLHRRSAMYPAIVIDDKPETQEAA